ncbi:MAG: hypothetical protein BWZ05_02213 [Bacteroidetes bacterium ADurb.BinA245]|nr:MAG: hypothetical protein BWZ05_02213 [Bacteroidetes bacterium ADurb.BinA245]
MATKRAKGIVKSYFKALSVMPFEFFPDKIFSKSARIFVSLSLLSSPLLSILKISLSPSSPYLPIKVSKFSIAGVSNG